MKRRCRKVEESRHATPRNITLSETRDASEDDPNELPMSYIHCERWLRTEGSREEHAYHVSAFDSLKLQLSVQHDVTLQTDHSRFQGSSHYRGAWAKLLLLVCCGSGEIRRLSQNLQFSHLADKFLLLVDGSGEINLCNFVILTSKPDQNDLKRLAQARRRCAAKILELYKMAGAGHIGSSLSCLEILVDLCFGRMEKDDVLVLSKGHAAAALYTTLSLSDRLPETELSTFYKDGTVLSAHPPCSGAVRAIPFGTGSLGHGLGLACGIAFSCRFTGKSFKVFAVLSDGDCNEGSTWEAVLFASQQKLSALTVVVDLNGVQGIGYTKNILNLEPIVDKWTSFGFAVAVAEDGNNFGSLSRAHEAVKNSPAPRCIIARTVKGHGISYMENRVEWHYLPMNEAQYAQALSELADPRLD